MKKTILLAILGLGISGIVNAAPNNAGCGWGTMIFDGEKGKTSEILAATTNGTSGNQTFGISSGTAGCASDGVVQKYAELEAFTGANIDQLARDASVGYGESIETLAGLMGIAKENRAEFFKVSKNSFSEIFSSASVTSEQVLAAYRKVMAANPVLRKYTV